MAKKKVKPITDTISKVTKQGRGGKTNKRKAAKRLKEWRDSGAGNMGR